MLLLKSNHISRTFVCQKNNTYRPGKCSLDRFQKLFFWNQPLFWSLTNKKTGFVNLSSLEKNLPQSPKSVQPNKTRFHTPKTQKKTNNIKLGIVNCKCQTQTPTIKLNWVKICNTKNWGDPKNVASFTASSNEFAPASKGGYGPFVNCHGFTPRHLNCAVAEKAQGIFKM